MKSKLMHNLGLKIMAVLISVVLWMLAVDINDPVINKYINNVQVQLTNTRALTGQGKTYRIVDNSDTIRVSVRAPKSAISAIDAQSVTAKADLSEITDRAVVKQRPGCGKDHFRQTVCTVTGRK